MGMVSPAPSDGEIYKEVEVEWMLPLAIAQEPCPAASAAAGPVTRDQARCLRIIQNVPTVCSVDLRGVKYGNIYAWVPKGAQAPLVNLGGRQLEAQYPANDSTAHVCTPQSDCSVIWVPISVNFKVEDTDGALAALSFTASGPSANYPDVKFALFENITLAYPPSPGSLPNELSTSTPSGGQPTSPLPESTDTNNRPSDATPSLFPTSSNPLVPITSAIPARGSTSQIGATSTGGHHANASVIVPAVLCALFGVAAVTFGVLWWLARRRGRAQMAPSAAFRANPETAWVPIDEKRQHLAGDGAGPSSTA